MRKAWALHSSGAEAQKLEGRGQKADPSLRKIDRSGAQKKTRFARDDRYGVDGGWARFIVPLRRTWEKADSQEWLSHAA